MNIEEKLKEVGKYFKDKVIAGDYEFISCSEYTAEILIDGKYELKIWIGNTPLENLRFYSYIESERQLFNTLNKWSSDDRLIAWERLKPFIISFKRQQLEAEKENRIQQLQNELNKLS